LSDNDIKTDYLQELMRMDIPMLSLEEERALGLRIAKGDHKALDKLVKHNLRFVPYVLKSGSYWQHGKTPVEDVIGIGNEMLIIAAKRWKPMGNIRFSAFARSFIIRGVQRELDNTSNIIRLPINIMEGIKRMNYNEQALAQVLGRVPTVQELATLMDVSTSKIHQLKGYLSREPVSLDALNQEKHSEENEE
jgi:DNA-directed RNA polymerase sigma subunit (sigma70/sigma32)